MLSCYARSYFTSFGKDANHEDRLPLCMKDIVQVDKWGISTFSFKCFKNEFRSAEYCERQGYKLFVHCFKYYTQFMKNNSSQSETHHVFRRQGWYFLHPNVMNLLYKSLAEN